MNDPYRVLGISPDATDEEVKQAYRELAKKYHPDAYLNNPLASLAQEKMAQINDAYDQIKEERTNRTSGHNNQSSYHSGGNGGSRFPDIRAAMQRGNYADAEMQLDSVPQKERNAEWNFLKGCVLLQRGWYTDAQKYLETACYMDPQNAEYRATLNRITQNASGYGRAYRETNRTGDNGMCDLCTNLICLDCLCEMMGGDFISCC